MSVFVSPTGSDTTGDGSEAKPYASLNRVQSAVRMLLQQQHVASAGNITVNVGGGRYELDTSHWFLTNATTTPRLRHVASAGSARPRSGGAHDLYIHIDDKR